MKPINVTDYPLVNAISDIDASKRYFAVHRDTSALSLVGGFDIKQFPPVFVEKYSLFGPVEFKSPDTPPAIPCRKLHLITHSDDETACFKVGEELLKYAWAIGGMDDRFYIIDDDGVIQFSVPKIGIAVIKTVLD